MRQKDAMTSAQWSAKLDSGEWTRGCDGWNVDALYHKAFQNPLVIYVRPLPCLSGLYRDAVVAYLPTSDPDRPNKETVRFYF